MAAGAAKKGGKASAAKPKPAAKAAAAAAADVKSPQATKRKAVEDASPVAAKKAKPAAEKKPKAKKETAAATASTDGDEVVATKAKKSAKKAKKADKEEKPVEEPVAGDHDGEESGSEDEEQTQALVRTLGFSDNDEEEGDGAEKSTFKAGGDVGVVPKVSAKTRKAAEAAAASGDGPRVIYIGHIPHGFFEHEIRQYLTQFGPIVNLRLSRNKKTGASKGYAFVEFADAATAGVVARTMDAYLLFGRILRVRPVPEESRHPDLFKGANRRYKRVPRTQMAARELERPRGEEEWKGVVGREQRRRSGRLEKLREAMGYEYDAPELKTAVAKEAAPAPVVVVEEKVEEKEEAPTKTTRKRGKKGKEEEQPKAIEAAPAVEKIVVAPVEEKEEVAVPVSKSPATTKVKAAAGKAKKGRKTKS